VTGIGKVNSARPLVVVMGVSAAGKSTISARLAQDLGLDWIDGDVLHPAANVAKMSAGIPLTDDDRYPWLNDVGSALDAKRGIGLVVACSALRRAYRDRIRRRAPDVVFIHLFASTEVLAARVAARQEHFMPATLLASQFALLEPDERGGSIDVDAAIDDIVNAAARWVRSNAQ
jgi:gluconokinase